MKFDPGYDDISGPARICFGEQFYSGQLLSSGEPTATFDEVTREWTTHYPLLWVPGPPTVAHSFGGMLAEVSYVQAATA